MLSKIDDVSNFFVAASPGSEWKGDSESIPVIVTGISAFEEILQASKYDSVTSLFLTASLKLIQ